jgi:ADP-ribose pyrophosphatase YjhB (NUDIX family)
MKFCPSCAAPVTQRIPEGDHLPRSVCTACGTIHYRNPKLIAGCVPEHEGRLLICRRAIEPRRGYWTVPAGFMEIGESLQQAAARECQEEARARLADPAFGVGVESLETVLCEEREIPWRDIAFASVAFALRRYLADRAAGREDLHFHTLA